MKYLLILLLLLPSSTYAINVKRIDPYANIKFEAIENLYSSKSDITIRFDGRGNYRRISLKLLSLDVNGMVKVEFPRNIITNEYVKLLKGVDSQLSMKVISFDGEIDVIIRDIHSNKSLLVVKLRGIIHSDLHQRTTIYNDAGGVRIYHNLQYRDWSFNVGVRESDESIQPNFSISKKW